MNKYEFMTLVLIAWALVAVGLVFALRDDGRTRRIYVRHEQRKPEPISYRVERELAPGRAAALPPVIDVSAVPTGQPRKELER